MQTTPAKFTPELFNRAQQLIYNLLDKELGKNHGYIVPLYLNDKMGVVAGFAYYDLRIELNTILFLENIEDFFENTIPHETSHIIQYIKYPKAKQGHGPEWKTIMRNLGYTPTRCHNYNISAVSSNKMRYTCKCEDKLFWSGKNLHSKIQSGDCRSCPKCKTHVIYSPVSE
jgi:SprT protein